MSHFLNDRRGATAIEYAMIAAMVAIGLITCIQSAGVSVKGMFDALMAGFS